jgi:hypothetical protein
MLTILTNEFGAGGKDTGFQRGVQGLEVRYQHVSVHAQRLTQEFCRLFAYAALMMSRATL